jgi:hypothetical protein
MILEWTRFPGDPDTTLSFGWSLTPFREQRSLCITRNRTQPMLDFPRSSPAEQERSARQTPPSPC